MKEKLIVAALSLFLTSCVAKKRGVVKENNNIEINNIVKHINSLVSDIQVKLPKQNKLVATYQENKIEGRILTDISETEAFYYRDKVVKIVEFNHLVNNIKELKEFYFANDELIYIKVNQLVFLKTQPKRRYLRELFFLDKKIIVDKGKDNNKVSPLELLTIAETKLNNEYNKI